MTVGQMRRSQGGKGRSVLIVEDESLVALDLAHSLTDLGFDVVDTVATGDQALRMASERQPDMALVDIRIQGDQDGIETAALLRSRFHVPVVYLTAHAEERTLERAIPTEPYGYLLKPFNPTELKSVLEIALYKHDVDVRLRENEESLYTTLNSIADAVIATDTGGRITRMNRVASQLTGCHFDEARGRPLEEVFRVRRSCSAGESAPGFARFEDGKDDNLERATLTASDGTQRPIAESAAPIIAADGTNRGRVLVFRDQTAERKAEERRRADAAQLRRSEAQLAEAQRIAHVGSWEWDARTSVSWSAELFRIVGRDPAVHPASHALLLECVHPEERQMFDAAVQLALRERQQFSLEHRIVRPSGEVRIVRSGGQVFADAHSGQVHMTATAQDLTEQRALEQQLVIAGRLASMGTLASGVAHEINNPMTYVVGNIDMALDRLSSEIESPERVSRSTGPPGEEAAPSLPSLQTRTPAPAPHQHQLELLRDVRDLLLRSLHGAERVCQIVRDLKVFSRADDLRKPCAIAIKPVLESSISICWNEVRYRARLVKEYAEELPLVDAGESRLGQVFVNLLVNAAHAIVEGRHDENEIRVVTRVAEDGNLVVEFRDTGCGIPHAALNRIFEPFFTTKPIGVGTGLGLSICHGIVASLGGRLEVESELGRGSTFRVVLPPSSTSATSKPSSFPSTAGAQGRILVIDDDPLVAEAVQCMLATVHDVVTHTNPKDALTRIVRGERFDLILCDLIMPEMTGMDLYQQVLEHAPDAANSIVLMTGGAATPLARQFMDGVPNPRIQKPFGQKALRDMISSLLRKA
jgi:PAS domain S-box-containing protein